RHHHPRLLHLRGGLPLLPDGVGERRGVDPVHHRGRPDDHLLPLTATLGALPVSAGSMGAPAGTWAPGPSRRRRDPGRLRGRAGRYAILIAGGLVMIVPFLWMVATSLKTRAEVFGAGPLEFPTGLHLDNFSRMWSALPGVTFGDFFLNSLKIATLATIG